MTELNSSNPTNSAFPAKPGWTHNAFEQAASREIMVQEANGEKRYIKVTVRSASSDRLRELMNRVDQENAALVELSKAYDIGGATKSLRLTKNAENEQVISTKSKDNRIQERKITDLTRELTTLGKERPEYKQYKLIIGIYNRLYGLEPAHHKPPPAPRPAISDALDQSSSIELELQRVEPPAPPPSPSSKKLMISMTRVDDDQSDEEEEEEDRRLLPQGASSSDLLRQRHVTHKPLPTPAPKPIPSSVPRKKYDSAGKTGRAVFSKENPNIEAIEPVQDETNLFRSQVSPNAQARPWWIKQKLVSQALLPAVNLPKDRLESQLITFESLHKHTFGVTEELNSYQRMALKTSDDILIDSYAIFNPKQKGVPAAEQKWIVYFHPNKMGYEESLSSLNLIATHTGANILTGNYRGVGQSQGMPSSDEDLIEDGRTMLKMLLDSGVPHENIVLQGLSIGGAVATALVQKGEHLVNDRSFTSYTAAAGRVTRFIGALARFVTWLSGYRFPSHEHYYKNIEKSAGHVIALSNKIDDVVGEGARFPEGLNLTEVASSEEVRKAQGKGKPLRVHIDLKLTPNDSNERLLQMSNITYVGLEAHISPLIDQISDSRRGIFVINRIQAEYPTYVTAIQTALDLPLTPLPRAIRDQINNPHLSALNTKLENAKKNFLQRKQAIEGFIAQIDISFYTHQELADYLAEATGEKPPLPVYVIGKVNARYKAMHDKAIAKAVDSPARQQAHLDYLNRILFESNADADMLATSLRRGLGLGNGPLPDFVIRAVNRRFAQELQETSKGLEPVAVKERQIAQLQKLLLPENGDLAPILREGLNIDPQAPLPPFVLNYIEEKKMEKALAAIDDSAEIQRHLGTYLTRAILPQQTEEEKWIDLQEFWADFQRRQQEPDGAWTQIEKDLNRSRTFQDGELIFDNKVDSNTPKVQEICDQIAAILTKPIAEQLLYNNTQTRIAGITKHLIGSLGLKFDVANDKQDFKSIYSLNISENELVATTLIVFDVMKKATQEPILGYIPVKLTTRFKLPEGFNPHEKQYNLSTMQPQVESVIAPVMRDKDQVQAWLSSELPL